MILKLHKNVQQFLRFGGVGTLNTLTHFLVLSALVELLSFNPVVGNFFAFIVSNIISYILNSHFTFGSPLAISTYFKFFLASLLGLFLTVSISWVMNTLGFHYIESFIVIVITVPLFNFSIMKFWCFLSD